MRALRPKVEDELIIRRIQGGGILPNVELSDQATPIVPVPKKDGSFSICGDYKGTVNAEQQAEQNPLPRIEDIFAKIARAEILKDWPSSGIPPTTDGGRFQEIPHYQHAHGSVSAQQTGVRHHISTYYGSAPLIKCWKEHLACKLYPWRYDHQWQGWWRTHG